MAMDIAVPGHIHHRPIRIQDHIRGRGLAHTPVLHLHTALILRRLRHRAPPQPPVPVDIIATVAAIAVQLTGITQEVANNRC